MSQKPIDIELISEPHGDYNNVPQTLVKLVSPYLVDLTLFIQEQYFAMSDTFVPDDVMGTFFYNMQRRERLLAEALDESDDGFVTIDATNPYFAAVLEIAKVKGIPYDHDRITFASDVDIKEWVARNGASAEDK